MVIQKLRSVVVGRIQRFVFSFSRYSLKWWHIRNVLIIGRGDIVVGILNKMSQDLIVERT